MCWDPSSYDSQKITSRHLILNLYLGKCLFKCHMWRSHVGFLFWNSPKKKMFLRLLVDFMIKLQNFRILFFIAGFQWTSFRFKINWNQCRHYYLNVLIAICNHFQGYSRIEMFIVRWGLFDFVNISKSKIMLRDNHQLELILGYFCEIE